jgi:hypothetical protein
LTIISQIRTLPQATRRHHGLQDRQLRALVEQIGQEPSIGG